VGWKDPEAEGKTEHGQCTGPSPELFSIRDLLTQARAGSSGWASARSPALLGEPLLPKEEVILANFHLFGEGSVHKGAGILEQAVVGLDLPVEVSAFQPGK
jgi:hypothetical protein